MRANTVDEVLNNYWVHKGCWVYQGYIAPTGYGVVSIRCKLIKVHRLAFKTYNGSIAPGVPVCHTCDVKACIHPDHLVQRPQRWNVEDMVRKGRANYSGLHRAAEIRSAKTHCIRGHELSGDNVYISNDRGRRQCRACKKSRGDAVGIGMHIRGEM